MEDRREDDRPSGQAERSSSGQPLFGKNKFVWHCDPPAAGRRREQDIIRTPPGVTSASQCDNIVDTFHLLITAEIIDNIVLQTNREGKRRTIDWIAVHPDHQPREWKAVTDVEIRAFIGLCILAGVYKCNHESTHRLWSEDEGRPVFKATMSRNRFTDILKFMRFDDKTSRPQRQQTDKLAAFADIWAMFVNQLPKYYIPGTDLCIDEQLVAFRGRALFRQYISSKPAKYGIKIWWCCDAETCYPLAGQVYIGKQPGEQREVGQGARVVQDLISSWRHSGRNVVTDNFFTSVELAQNLLVQGLTFVGTIRSNKPHIPEAMRANSRRPEHSSIFGFSDQITLVSYVPKVGKSVIVLSTMHHDKAIEGSLSKPEIIHHYNACKSGVDNLDHLVTMYTSRRKTNRWPMVLFWNMIDVAAVGAFILWLGNNTQWEVSKGRRRRNLFLRQLGYDLVKPQMELRAQVSTLQAPIRLLMNIVISNDCQTLMLILLLANYAIV